MSRWSYDHPGLQVPPPLRLTGSNLTVIISCIDRIQM